MYTNFCYVNRMQVSTYATEVYIKIGSKGPFDTYGNFERS